MKTSSSFEFGPSAEKSNLQSAAVFRMFPLWKLLKIYYFDLLICFQIILTVFLFSFSRLCVMWFVAKVVRATSTSAYQSFMSTPGKSGETSSCHALQSRAIIKGRLQSWNLIFNVPFVYMLLFSQLLPLENKFP